MSMKMEEGDLRGAIRLASSNSSIAAPTEDTFHVLLDKHPPPPSDYSPPPLPIVSAPISVSQAKIARAIKSFPLGSSAGPDGLRPRHLKDILLQTLSILLSSLLWLIFRLSCWRVIHHPLSGLTSSEPGS